MGCEEEVTLRVVRQWRERAARELVAEGRGRLDRQLVARQVLWAEHDGMIHRLDPRTAILPRQSVNQVEGDGFEACVERPSRGFGRLGAGVTSAQEGEGLVIERLQAQAQVGDAQRTPGGQPRGVDILWVGFEE